MGETTAIQWCDHTFNPWRGCTKVSEGCANCYAETLSKRNPYVLGEWGAHGMRPRASLRAWENVRKWHARAVKSETRAKVFFSLGDWLEERTELVGPLADLMHWIAETPDGLDWLLLTKRPQVWRSRIESVMTLINRKRQGDTAAACMVADWLKGKPPANVWVGISVENQDRADERIPALLEIPAALRFVSAEPLLGPIRFRFDWLVGKTWPNTARGNGIGGQAFTYDPPPIEWIIVGGESGPDARPCDLAWVYSIRDQCDTTNTHLFIKQLGRHPYEENPEWQKNGRPPRIMWAPADRKGGDPDEWPEDLRVREMPR